jgi:hypothetical protein
VGGVRRRERGDKDREGEREGERERESARFLRERRRR